MDRIKTKLQALSSDMQKYQSELEKKSKQFLDLSDDVAKHCSIQNERANHLQELNEKYHEIERNYNEKKSKLQKYEIENEEEKRSHQVIQHNMETNTSLIRQRESKMNSLISEKDSKQKAIVDIMGKIKEFEDKLEAMEKRCSNAEILRKKLENDITYASYDVNSVKVQHDKSCDAIEVLKAKESRLKEKLIEEEERYEAALKCNKTADEKRVIVENELQKVMDRCKEIQLELGNISVELSLL